VFNICSSTCGNVAVWIETSFFSRNCSLSTIHLATKFVYTIATRQDLRESPRSARAPQRRQHFCWHVFLHSVGQFLL